MPMAGWIVGQLGTREAASHVLDIIQKKKKMAGRAVFLAVPPEMVNATLASEYLWRLEQSSVSHIIRTILICHTGIQLPVDG
uniref:Uncharacterized protein n=1 Tax=Nelumbo nucifera TaxID=4432 RepID=A0A822Y999_NELNU|nr:TPA_asm: hypothetical protein HUJ06_027636 [Nelumbo nucifera]